MGLEDKSSAEQDALSTTLQNDFEEQIVVRGIDYYEQGLVGPVTQIYQTYYALVNDYVIKINSFCVFLKNHLIFLILYHPIQLHYFL